MVMVEIRRGQDGASDVNRAGISGGFDACEDELMAPEARRRSSVRYAPVMRRGVRRVREHARAHAVQGEAIVSTAAETLRGGMIPFFSERLKTTKESFVAAASPGKRSLANTPWPSIWQAWRTRS